jgi:beta-N-acetylhexosaminidase
VKRLSSGGRFIVMGVPEKLDAAARRAIRALQPGGFILFGRNIGLPPIPDAQGRPGIPGSPERLRALIEKLRSLVDHEPVICLDQEGGRVSRLRGLEGGAEPPSARGLAAAGKADLIRRHGRLTGLLLRLFGINLDLCPVLDVAYDLDADNSLQNRCWGETPEQAARNAGLFNRALRAQGVLSCGKHFPGYSRASVDPHHELPVVRASRAELEKDWRPYRELLPELDFVMTGHAFYPALDSSGVPTSLSETIVSGLLRGEMGFRGWVMSDDLDMGAVTRRVGLEEAATRAVRAGTDQILLCHDLGRAHDAARAISRLPSAVLRPGRGRLDALQKRLKPAEQFSPASFGSINRAIQRLRDSALGPDAPRFSGGAGKIGAVEAARISPVNVVGDRAAGAPAEYAPARVKGRRTTIPGK